MYNLNQNDNEQLAAGHRHELELLRRTMAHKSIKRLSIAEIRKHLLSAIEGKTLEQLDGQCVYVIDLSRKMFKGFSTAVYGMRIFKADFNSIKDLVLFIKKSSKAELHSSAMYIEMGLSRMNYEWAHRIFKEYELGFFNQFKGLMSIQKAEQLHKYR